MRALEQFTPLIDAVVSRIHEGIILADNTGAILFHNPAAAELLGHPAFFSVDGIRASTGIDLQQSLTSGTDSTPCGNQALVKRGSFEQCITCNGKPRFVQISSSSVPIADEPAPVSLLVISDITDRRRLQGVLSDDQSSGLVTQDPQMIEISLMMERIAPTCASVLLQGESGTGKSLLARMIHAKSDRGDAPLVEVNCAAIPDALLESELFGHVKGAFTGATQNRKGRLQAAHGGTLFLDELSELPLHLQPKLLKALEEQTFQMLGSDENIHVDVRIIVASNRNLRDMVDAGSFRADLYYRLAVIPVDIPALRDRPGDIPLLIHAICDQLIRRGYPPDMACGEKAMQLMMDYPWPGNVRELANAVEHCMILAKNGRVTVDALPFDVRHYRHNGAEPRQPQRVAAPADADPHKREILDALARSNGNRAKAARSLGIDRSTLWRRMNRLSLI